MNGSALPFGRAGRKPKYGFDGLDIGQTRRFLLRAGGQRARDAAMKWARRNRRVFRSATRGAYVYVRRVA